MISDVNDDANTTECTVDYGLPNVEAIVERLDVIKEGNTVRTPSEDEQLVLQRIREIFHSEEIVPIPSLKAKDNWLILKEVSLVNKLLGNLSLFCHDVRKSETST